MAFSCVKIQFDIGHEATLRSEITPQGFTHDWVVFVRGVDNAEIHHFVEKVVFNLHESFPKPKRVIKEPPYEVRESGYASFAFPVEVYLKSKEEPRKLEFLYDLSLNTSGPIRTSQREKRFFNNPSEEFRRKLIRGGGVGVGSDLLPLSDNNSQNTDEKSSSKKSSSESKKHKSKESVKGDDRTSNQFADLFGTPIKTAKLSPTTTSKRADSKHSIDKVPSKSLSKHSPHKEKDKEVSKKDTLNSSSSKEKDKDRERSKEKDKKTDKSLKRPPSPAATPPPAKVFKEDPKKSSHEEAKERDKAKSSSSSDVSKNEKKDKKKDKKNRDEKDKKDRHKDHDIKKELSLALSLPPPPPTFVEKDKVSEKPEKFKSESKESKENIKKSPKHFMKEEKLKDKNDKEKTESIEKQRHKHKKKEKDKKEEKESKEKEREKPQKKPEKLPPAPPIIPKEPSPPPQPPPTKSRIRSPGSKNPLTALMLELPLSDKESDTESSGDDDVKSVEKVKMSPPSPPPPPAPNPPVPRTPERVKEDKFMKEKLKKRDKKNPKDEDGTRKKKRKSKEKEEVIQEKVSKAKVEENTSPIVREDPVDEEVDERLSEPSPIVNSPHIEEQEVSRSRSPSPLKFTEEYVMELKDLQQKIMTLEDNAELQRVVQVIAETGQYEITKKTFDFDLCALDKSTVKRLQDLFFAAS